MANNLDKTQQDFLFIMDVCLAYYGKDKKMSIAKQFIIIVMGCLIVACSVSKKEAGQTAVHRYALDEVNTHKGQRYLLGRGVPKNSEKAFQYFQQAAKHGDPFAANQIAYLFAAGKGTTKNYLEAMKYYQLAADYGLASAQYNLGLFYQYGLGVKKNRQLAKQWILKASQQGFQPAKQSTLLV